MHERNLQFLRLMNLDGLAKIIVKDLGFEEVLVENVKGGVFDVGIYLENIFEYR